MSHQLLLTVVVALACGAIVQVLAHHLRFPAMGLLLLTGVFVGPEFLGLVRPASLAGGLESVVSLAVAIILFEGGLTLDLAGLRAAPRVIRRLVTSGAVITWLCSAALALAFLDVSFPIALLAGSLIIVTGPTVVTPLLRRIGVKQRLNHILHWEAVLIDPVGVFVALLCFEWVILYAYTGAASPLAPLAGFAIRVVAGTGIGVAGGLGLAFALRRRWIPSDHANITVLAIALLIYGVADQALPHTGILAVTIAGFVIGWKRPPQIKKLQAFKLELTELSVAFIFILLAADLEIEAFAELGGGGALLIASLIFVVRPLVIASAAWREDLSWREMTFLSWIAPRGIVAASMASLFGNALEHAGIEGATIVEPFTFAVIATTVLLQGSTAGLVARILKVRQVARRGWLIVGARHLGRELGHALQAAQVPVVIIDRNDTEVAEAQARGLVAIHGDASDPTLGDDPLLAEVGNALVATDNPALNQLLAESLSEQLGSRRVHTWSSLCTGRSLGQDIRSAPAKDSLALPEKVNDALDDHTLVIDVLSPDAELPDYSRVILSVDQGSARVRPGDATPAELRITLSWRQVLADDLFRRVVMLSSRTTPEAVSELIGHASVVHSAFDESFLKRELEEQSDLRAMVVANGVAIPHVRSSAVVKPVCVVGVVEGAGPDDDLQLICLLISPAGAPDLHLEALARLASWASDKERVRALATASSEAQALAGLNSFASRTLSA